MPMSFSRIEIIGIMRGTMFPTSIIQIWKKCLQQTQTSLILDMEHVFAEALHIEDRTKIGFRITIFTECDPDDDLLKATIFLAAAHMRTTLNLTDPFIVVLAGKPDKIGT